MNKVDDRTPDSELVRFWQAGQSRDEVFSLLHRRYAPELARLFQRLGFGDQACQDLGQDAFLQAFRSLDRFRGAASFRTWLHQIARNAARKHLRHHRTKKRAAEEVSLERSAGDDPSPENDPRLQAEASDGPLEKLMTDEVRRQVREAVDELPAADRRMVFFRIWQGLGVRETAQAMKKPEGTVKSGWSRIRQSLGEKLGSHFSDLPP